MVLLLIILGLVLGSFLTAFIDRIHDGRDWVAGRSECDSCKAVLQPKDLVPVLSWLYNRGRCAYCSKKVSFIYPVTEILTAILLVVSYLNWPGGLEGFDIAKFILWCVFVVGFVGLSIYDLKWLIIPNKIVYPLIALAAGMVAVEAIFYEGGTQLVRDSVLGLLSVGGLFFLLFQVSSGRWIGGGDVKLGFLLGLLAGGYFEGALLIMIASFLGLFAALPFIIARKVGAKSQIPFGPVLMMAGFIIYLFGERLVDWYTTNFLYL